MNKKVSVYNKLLKQAIKWWKEHKKDVGMACDICGEKKPLLTVYEISHPELGTAHLVICRDCFIDRIYRIKCLKLKEINDE